MISRDMYRVLKMIPRDPKRITFQEMLGTDKKRNKQINEIFSILEDAKEAKFIVFSPQTPYGKLTTNAFCLTEMGQASIEEYSHRHLDSRRSLWAIIISIVGTVASITISLISLIAQQSAGQLPPG